MNLIDPVELGEIYVYAARSSSFLPSGLSGNGLFPRIRGKYDNFHQTLRDNPKTRIQLVKGPDQLCEKYPNSGEYHCQNDNIYERDAAILEKLGLKIGQILKWEDIESHIRKYVVPSDIQNVCETCSWRSYGVCEEGIQEILEGKGLREVK